jgi:hypothetical protein
MQIHYAKAKIVVHIPFKHDTGYQQPSAFRQLCVGVMLWSKDGGKEWAMVHLSA